MHFCSKLLHLSKLERLMMLVTFYELTTQASDPLRIQLNKDVET